MPESVDLAHAMRLEPRDAVDYFRSKGYAISWNWEDTWAAAHAHGFTVAKAATLDVLSDIRRGADRALSQGMSEGEFVRLMSLRLQKLGWWGRQVAPETEAGGAQLYQAGSFHRLKTIYRTNLQSAFAAGRWKQMLEDADRRPYLQYVAVLDSKTRPSHRALHGRVMRFDDPAWAAIAPPNGFNCRCRLRSLGERQIAREGLTVQSSEGHLAERQVTDPRTGLTEESVALRLPGMPRALAPDLGWSYNPGAAAFGTDMKAARSLSLIEDREIRRQAIQALNGNPWRHEEFARWVDEVRGRREPIRSVQVVGFLDERDIEAAVARGADPVRVAAIPDSALLHADRARHAAEGVALAAYEYHALPELLRNPDAVYWDRWHDNLVFVKEAADGRLIYMPLEPGTRVKKRGRLDAVVNAYKVPKERLADATRYEKVR